MRNEIENVLEPDIEVIGKGIDDEDVRMLFAKSELIKNAMFGYWKPTIATGKKMMSYAHGRVFDATTRAIYEEVQKKICVEPKILKPRINSLVGQIMQGKRSGRISSEGGKSADEIALANMIIKYFEQNTPEQFLLNSLLFDGCLTGCPQAILFDHSVSPSGDQLAGLSMEKMDFDSFVLSPFKMADGSDATEIIMVDDKSKAQLIDEFPDQEDVILKHFNMVDSERLDISGMLDKTQGMTAEDARFLKYDIISGIGHTKMNGRSILFNRVFPAKIKTQVAILRSSTEKSVNDYQILPPEWSKTRKQQWAQQNPQYAVVTTYVKVLWNTKWTNDGLVLLNKVHWFQESTEKGMPILPIAVFVPQIIDGISTGPGPDDEHLILMKAISETEGLHDIRCGSGDVFAYKKGAIINSEDLPTELSIGNGIIQVDDQMVPPGSQITSAINFLKRTPNTAYIEYSQKINNDLDQTDLINRSAQGQEVSSQQSGKAKEVQIARFLVGYNNIADNFNKTFQRVKNMECMMIPYVFTEEQTMMLPDDERQVTEAVVVNKTSFDMQGNKVILSNDLTSVKWKWRLVPGDDSATARQQELNEMLIFWNTSAPALIQADETLTLLASVMMSMSNKTAKEIGRVIQEKAQVKAQQMSQQQMMKAMAELDQMKAKAESERTKSKRSGVIITMKPEDFRMYPEAYQVLSATGFIGPQGQFGLPNQAEPTAPQQSNQAGPVNPELAVAA